MGEEKMKTYAEHYKRCLEINPVTSSGDKYDSLYDLSIDADFLATDERYFSLVEELAKDIRYRLDNNLGCYNGSSFARYVNDCLEIESLKALVNHVAPQVEREIFHCGIQVEFVMPYRNNPTKEKPAASWLWHYDDCPREFLKFVVYLNEVTEENGCFQFMVDEKNNAPIVPSSRHTPHMGIGQQLYKGSRIPPKVIDEICKKGGRQQSLIGPPGTYGMLTPNIMHRATIPQSHTAPRDCLFLFIRPSLQKMDSYFNHRTRTILPKKNVKVYNLD
jgi:hypothetical protein